MKHFLRQPPKQERGAALVEYGILLGLIAIVSIGAVSSLGNEVNDTFTTINSSLEENLGTVGGETGGTGGGTGGGTSDPNPPWTDLTSYPSGGDCSPIASNGSYTSGSTCYTLDIAHEVNGDFSAEASRLTFRVSGTDADWGDGADAGIYPPSAGAAYIVSSFGAGTRAFLDANVSGDTYMLFSDRNCSEITLTDAGFGVLSLDFSDGSEMKTHTDLDGIYCAGDDTVWDQAYIQSNMSAPSGGGGPSI